MRTSKSPKHKSNFTNERWPIRFKDGLYLADISFCKDISFITSHKVTHIIKAVPGEYEKTLKVYSQSEVSYLEVSLSAKEIYIAEKMTEKIYDFIEEAANQGESVLICAKNKKSIGKNVAIVYFMRKFRWSLDKCMMFMDRILGVQTEKVGGECKSEMNEEEGIAELRIAEKFIEESDKGKSMSVSWENSTIEEIDVVNMYKNGVSVLIEKSRVRTGKKRVSWAGDSKVSYFHQSQICSKTCREPGFMLTPILKCPSPELEEPPTKCLEALKVTEIAAKQFEANNIITCLKNNHLRLSANNYLPSAPATIISMSTPIKIKNSIYENPPPEKNTQTQSPFVYNSSPSINKRRVRSECKREEERRHSGGRIAPYQNIISSIKSPFDQSAVPNTRPAMNQFLFHSQEKSKFRSYSLQPKPVLFGLKENPNESQKLNWKSINCRTTVNIMKYYNSSERRV